MTAIAPKATLANRIDQGRGIIPADIVLKGGRVFCLAVIGKPDHQPKPFCLRSGSGHAGGQRQKRQSRHAPERKPVPDGSHDQSPCLMGG